MDNFEERLTIEILERSAYTVGPVSISSVLHRESLGHRVDQVLKKLTGTQENLVRDLFGRQMTFAEAAMKRRLTIRDVKATMKGALEQLCWEGVCSYLYGDYEPWPDTVLTRENVARASVFELDVPMDVLYELNQRRMVRVGHVMTGLQSPAIRRHLPKDTMYLLQDVVLRLGIARASEFALRSDWTYDMKAKTEPELTSVSRETKAKAEPEAEREFASVSLKTSLLDVGLSNRSTNALHRCGLYTLRDLVAYLGHQNPEGVLANIPGIGNKSQNEIISMLTLYEILPAPSEV